MSFVLGRLQKSYLTFKALTFKFNSNLNQMERFPKDNEPGICSVKVKFYLTKISFPLSFMKSEILTLNLRTKPIHLFFVGSKSFLIDFLNDNKCTNRVTVCLCVTLPHVIINLSLLLMIHIEGFLNLISSFYILSLFNCLCIYGMEDLLSLSVYALFTRYVIIVIYH